MKLIFALGLALSNIANAGEYSLLKEGQKAPSDGYFFDEKSMAELLASYEAEKLTAIRQTESDFQFKLDRQQIEFKYEVDKMQIKFDSLQERSEQIIQLKDKQIDDLQELVLNDPKKKWILPVVVISSVVVTAGACIGVTYAVSGAF